MQGPWVWMTHLLGITEIPLLQGPYNFLGRLGGWQSGGIFLLKNFFFVVVVDHFFKVLIKFVTMSLLFYILVFWSGCAWDLRFPNQGSNPHPLRWKAKS